jgi:hypothetical protein
VEDHLLLYAVSRRRESCFEENVNISFYFSPLAF